MSGDYFVGLSHGVALALPLFVLMEAVFVPRLAHWLRMLTVWLRERRIRSKRSTRAGH